MKINGGHPNDNQVRISKYNRRQMDDCRAVEIKLAHWQQQQQRDPNSPQLCRSDALYDRLKRERQRRRAYIRRSRISPEIKAWAEAAADYILATEVAKEKRAAAAAYAREYYRKHREQITAQKRDQYAAKVAAEGRTVRPYRRTKA